MCCCGTIIACCILFAIAIALAVYYGVIQVDEDALKEAGSMIKGSIKDGLKKLSED